MVTMVRVGGRESNGLPDPAAHARDLIATLEAALGVARRMLDEVEAARNAPTSTGAHPSRALARWSRAHRPPRRPRGNTEASLDTQELVMSQPPRPIPADLSSREVEVLALVAAGRSNRDMAQALFLSPRTVQRHVANVYLKIGVHNRAEATAYALKNHLA